MVGRTVSSGWLRRRRAHLRLGRRGERLAAALATELGLEVMTRNYVGRSGEIDLVARHPQTAILSFIEVKTRGRLGRGRPGAAVGPGKRDRIIRTAHRYLRELGNPPIVYRFDVVEVTIVRARLKALHYWSGAFTEQAVDRQLEQRFPDSPAEFIRLARIDEETY